MELSVVVPTLNAREELADCLDALAEHAPSAEVLVVNGPSADGTTGMVRARDDVDVLVELADRTINAARNAGIDRARGDTIAFVNHTHSVTAEWLEALTEGLGRADAVSGPTLTVPGTGATDPPEEGTIADREVTYLNAGNFAFAREVSEALDGFDEYLEIGGARDFAHRLAANGFETHWEEGMQVKRSVEADGGGLGAELDWKYRSLTYRLVKNYGPRPTVFRRIASHALSDAYTQLRAVFRGESKPSQWFGAGRTVLANVGCGARDGLGARRRDREERRNPNGRSARADRAVAVYDWRD